jgi:molybdopterin molybdotransferase
MTNKLLDDCFGHDKKRLRHGEALAVLKQRIAPVAGTETVPLAMAAGRIVAAPAVAPRPVPAHTNAAVDGYAFAAADYDAAAGTALPVDGRAAAGHRLERAPAPGTAARIFTGAVMPAGHDTVVMQEDVEATTADGRTVVAIPAGLKRGANVRRAGEDVEAGETLVEAGAVLRPQELAALASIGMAEVACFARLRVAIVSTGDEVLRPGAAFSEGQV